MGYAHDGDTLLKDAMGTEFFAAYLKLSHNEWTHMLDISPNRSARPRLAFSEAADCPFATGAIFIPSGAGPFRRLLIGIETTREFWREEKAYP